MEKLKKIGRSLNTLKQCGHYNVPLWQCPQFLFVIMGIVMAVAIVATNIVAQKFVGPEIVALIVLALSAILFVISHIIVSSFERMARTSQAKSDFISIMSHRLRSPLSSVKWRLELLADKTDSINNEELSISLSEINGQNEKMIRIINDLLELNSIEDNRIILNRSAFPLKELVEETVGEQKNIPGNIDIPVIISAPDSLPDVFADIGKIKNVIFHLLDNAFRYSLKENKISIVLEELPKSVRCSITDEGAGILENERKKVFNKFFRSRGKLRYQTEGTGIGLFIAREIIKRSKGEMGFISVEGKGSTFWFTLPIAQTDN